MHSLFGAAMLAGHNGFATVGAMKDATSAKHSANRAEVQLKLMEANLAKSLMICEALWELLAEKTGLTLDDLHNKLYEVDMRDGVLDGKNQRSIVECPGCNRSVSPRHPACLYCGQVIDDSVFKMG